ncbi:hypothetical protein, partial [Xanthomonas citri]|uniref:hypothetical protein n=1 Tax=Xanthomonas citri TaxID=346 RepID=UPI003F6E2533
MWRAIEMTSHAARQRRPFRSTSPARYGRISMLALALSGAVGMLATGTACQRRFKSDPLFVGSP